MKTTTDVYIRKIKNTGKNGGILLSFSSAALNIIGEMGTKLEITSDGINKLFFKLNSNTSNFAVTCVGRKSYGFKCANEDYVRMLEKFTGHYNFIKEDEDTYYIDTRYPIDVPVVKRTKKTKEVAEVETPDPVKIKVQEFEDAVKFKDSCYKTFVNLLRESVVSKNLDKAIIIDEIMTALNF